MTKAYAACKKGARFRRCLVFGSDVRVYLLGWESVLLSLPVVFYAPDSLSLAFTFDVLVSLSSSLFCVN